jgi:osmotically-inducible protein OsmY
MRLLLLGAALGFLAYMYRSPAQRSAVPDDVLITRVRLKLNQLLEHPGSVNITVLDGRVTLSGPVAETELRKVVRMLRRLGGVRSLDCRLTPHAIPA